MSRFERISCMLVLVPLFVGGTLVLGCGDSSQKPATTEPQTTRPPSPPSPASPPEPATPPATPEPPTPPAPDASPTAGGGPPGNAEAGMADYQMYCASCHGQTGAGDGPVAPTLPVQPAKHNDGNYMNKLDDAYLFKVISEGGPSVGKSELMAPWGGSLSDQQIRNVIAYIRSLANPPYSPTAPTP